MKTTNGWNEPRTRWPHLTAAIGRYLAGPRPILDDLADAASTIGEYLIWRETAPADPVTEQMARVIRHALAERHRWPSLTGLETKRQLLAALEETK